MHIILKPDGLWQRTDNHYASTRRVHFGTTCGLTPTLTFDLLISKSKHFIFVSNCTKVVNLVKWYVRYRANKLSLYNHAQMYAHMHGQPKHRMPPAADGWQKNENYCTRNKAKSIVNQWIRQTACGNSKQHTVTVNINEKAKSVPSHTTLIEWWLPPFPQFLARHQLTQRDHVYGPRSSHGAPV